MENEISGDETGGLTLRKPGFNLTLRGRRVAGFNPFYDGSVSRLSDRGSPGN